MNQVKEDSKFLDEDNGKKAAKNKGDFQSHLFL
jgi:hypothetical protein